MGVLLLKQANRILSTYTADVSGVCSALYEMGGLTVMHDASGCNSTYNTHDEPRWYTMPSRIYISGLTEMEAMLGDEEKLLHDLVEGIRELKPRFCAVAGTPIPAMMGADLPGIARAAERRTGVPCFGFQTTGMQSYVTGASMAFEAVARRFSPALPRAEGLSVNLLGVTPLDFSVVGNVEALRALFAENGIPVRSCWAMGSSWEELMEAGRASVNLVLSSAGLRLAQFFREKYGAPYVVGIPMGEALTARYLSAVREAAQTGECRFPAKGAEIPGEGGALIIGEAVWAASMRRAYELFTGKPARVLCPLELDGETLAPGDLRETGEREIAAAMQGADLVIADPIYRFVLPNGIPFLRFPHEGYSGRIWRKEIPVFVGKSWDEWFSQHNF